jgi:ribose 5-phosphate isomerase B
VRIACGADHAGYAFKQALANLLEQAGHQPIDCGTHSEQSVDYPDVALEVCRALAGGDADLGILVCGTGVGMAMVANKVEGIRAANCHDSFCAGMARAHNDANVLALGARVIDLDRAGEIVNTFLSTPFEAGRHSRRLEKFPHVAASNAA